MWCGYEILGGSDTMKSLEIVNDKIAELKDTYQHYTAVEKDKAKSSFAKFDIEQFQQIKQDLEVLEIFKALIFHNIKSIGFKSSIKSYEALFNIGIITKEQLEKLKQWLEVDENVV